MNVKSKLKADRRLNAVFTNNFANKLKKLRRVAIDRVIDNMYGSSDTIAENAANLISEPYLEDFYKELYTNVGGYFARRQYNELLGLKEDVRDALWNRELQQW